MSDAKWEWTPANITILLQSSDKAVERAVLAIYARQTNDEQSHQTTVHTNGRGFSAAHARLGSYYAKWINSGKHLTGKHLVKARQITLHYVKQLAEIAEEKKTK